MTLHRIVNSFFNSCTYILHKEGSRQAILIDCGDFMPIKEYCDRNDLTITDALITHGHFDHIYGLNHLIQFSPDCKIHVSETGARGLCDPKINLSHYHEQEFTYNGKNINPLKDGDSLHLGDMEIKAVGTPGHTPGSLTYIVDHLIFTGDAYIPGIKTVTNLPGADKDQALKSRQLILELMRQHSLHCCPGHPAAEN